MAITLSVLNGFSKFFHCWKAKWISNKIHVIFFLPYLQYVAVLPCETLKFEFVAICKKKNNLKFLSYLTKTETSLVIWLNIVTIVARSVRLLPAHMQDDVRATRQLHCRWWCLVNAMPNMQKTLHQFTTDKIVCYLQRIFNRNRKLKQQVSKLSALKLCVCVQRSMHVTFLFAFFFQIYQNANF